jgi:hypothetical protein
LAARLGDDTPASVDEDGKLHVAALEALPDPPRRPALSAAETMAAANTCRAGGDQAVTGCIAWAARTS